ncbi:hypothetical protein LCGC14_1071670 [marine sediment metagenome]|uniref:DNA (cytosine-5-)-methyltransferase n=1 Tax=marine sediment metagenome TaxID=412755 RepID=A0A0F9N589_9ZZZZ
MKNSDKIILDLCGGTGSWSKPYKDAGYDVRLVTLPEFDIFQVNFWNDIIFLKDDYNGISVKDIYGILAAPPCTQFSKAAWNKKRIDRDFRKGMETVTACLEIIWKIQEQGAPLKFWALENPMGYLYNFLGHPAYYFQPWWFGEKGFLATKRTALWGYFNSPARIVRTRTIPFISPHTSKRDVADKKRENHTWYKASAEDRAITPAGFAKAFYKANQ